MIFGTTYTRDSRKNFAQSLSRNFLHYRTDISRWRLCMLLFIGAPIPILRAAALYIRASFTCIERTARLLCADTDMFGLALDWISGKLYGVGRTGSVFVCPTSTIGNITCTTVLSDQGVLSGIAVDPNSGYGPIC